MGDQAHESSQHKVQKMLMTGEAFGRSPAPPAAPVSAPISSPSPESSPIAPPIPSPKLSQMLM